MMEIMGAGFWDSWLVLGMERGGGGDGLFGLGKKEESGG
jgi:hypothetical protein